MICSTKPLWAASWPPGDAHFAQPASCLSLPKAAFTSQPRCSVIQGHFAKLDWAEFCVLWPMHGGNAVLTSPPHSSIIWEASGLRRRFFDGLLMRGALHLYSDPSVPLGWRFCIHCPSEDLCSGADSLGPPQIRPPAKVWLLTLLWISLALGTQWPKWASLPCKLPADLPFGLFKSLFIFKQPDFLCPAIAPPMAPARTSRRKMGHQLQHSPGAGSLYAPDFSVYK